MNKENLVLDVNDLSIDLKIDGNWFPVVSNLSFSLHKGEVLAIVGESGCGKSVTCLSLAKLLNESIARYSSGSITFCSEIERYDILSMSHKELRKIRGKKIAYVFQEPSTSLNPVFRVGEQVAEAIIAGRGSTTNIKEEVIALFELVGITDPAQRIYCYPHELSGGMQQRVMIAMALAGKPDILVADEPTTALDVTIQAQILQLLYEIQRKTGMAIILVTHNLGIVAEAADDVMIMYAGQAVEKASVRELFSSMSHPYTKALFDAVPKLGHAKEELKTISGFVPSLGDYSSGCRFYKRCGYVKKLGLEQQKLCISKNPEWQDYVDGHYCRCHWCNA